MTPAQQSALTALAAASQTLTATAAAVAEAERVLRVSLSSVEPPAPAPEPAPSPPPPAPAPIPPAPPPAGQAPTLQTQRLDMGRLVCFASWHGSSRYERYQRFERWVGAIVRIKIIGISLVGGGAPQMLLAQRYTLLVDGVERAAVNVPVGAQSAEFVLPLADLQSGWHELDIGGLAGAESCPRWFAYVANDPHAPEMMPVCTGSYDVTHEANGLHSWAWVPTRYTPTPRPLPRREYPPVTTGTPVRGIQMVPGDGGNINRPAIRDGVWTTFNTQSYFFSDLIRKLPQMHLLDGPRGVGTCGMVTHISIGAGRFEDKPDSPLMQSLYALDPWRLMRIAGDGTITTLAGFRHTGRAEFRGVEPVGELVGDWSTIPPERRGFHETWGWAWDSATLATDHAAAPLSTEQGRQPHIGNPAGVLTDTQNNRVCRVEFDGRNHRTPAKVTELITGLRDPWDVIEWRDSWLISERGANCIVQYSKGGVFERMVVASDLTKPGSAYVHPNRKAVRMGTLADMQAHPCMAPEGLYRLDDDWLYFGSLAQAQVRRVHLVTGELETVCDVQLDGNSAFLKFAVSDGTFGPRGAVFWNSWSNTFRAENGARLPGNVKWSPGGRAQPYSLNGYGCAVAVGSGRLVTSSSQEGVQVYGAALPGEAWNQALYDQGKAEYDAASHRLIHGPWGFGHYGYPLPDGSAAMRHFLEQHALR